MRQRMWVGVGFGVLVSIMLLGGRAGAADHPRAWQGSQATGVGSALLLPQPSGRAVELPTVPAPEPLGYLHPVPGDTRGALSGEPSQRLADGGDSPVRCTTPKCP